MKIKTTELTGAALDWAVAKCEGQIKDACVYERTDWLVPYSTNWSQGGPIIERCGIGLLKVKAIKSFHWVAGLKIPSSAPIYGPTPLIAAMRCHVENKLGDTVDVPDELIGETPCKT